MAKKRILVVDDEETLCEALQHSFWFKNYTKIRPLRKRVTTILLIVGILVLVSGIALMCGSRSELVSHIHYVTGILFTILAIGHVAKRWKYVTLNNLEQ